MEPLRGAPVEEVRLKGVGRAAKASELLREPAVAEFGSVGAFDAEGREHEVTRREGMEQVRCGIQPKASACERTAASGSQCPPGVAMLGMNSAQLTEEVGRGNGLEVEV